jgi:hypothetical protein
MVKYWQDQWETNNKTLKEELVQCIRIFIRCGFIGQRDHQLALAELIFTDVPTLQNGVELTAGRKRAGGHDTLARLDR